MQLGHAARRAGRTTEALGHYRSAVEQDPESAEAHSVYGLMLLQLGRAGEAEAPLRKAVEIAPRTPRIAHESRPMACAPGQDGRRGASRDPGRQRRARALVGLGPAWRAECKAAEFPGGGRLLTNARATLRPEDPSLLFKLAQACLDDGRKADAERVFARAASLARTTLAMFRQQAGHHEARGNWAALEATAKAWIAVHPHDPEAWRVAREGAVGSRLLRASDGQLPTCAVIRRARC